MRSLKVIVVHKLCKPLGDGSPTADPRVVKAVNSHFEGVKPLFEEVSVYIVEMTAQLYSKEGSQIPVAINKKLSACEVVFLGKSLKKFSRWVGASAVEEIDAE